MAKSTQKKKTIKVSEIRKISGLQLSDREAAAFFGLRPKAFKEMLRIDVAAREAWEDRRELGKVSLRATQFELSKRSAPMAIFLGKQILGQTEVQVIEHSGRDGEPIKTLDLGKLDRSQRSHLREILDQARTIKKA